MRRARLLASTLLVVLVAGCNDDGRTLRPAEPGQEASISTVAVTTDTTGTLIGEPDTSGGSVPAGGLSLIAPWREGAEIDARYSCDGPNLAPALSWSTAPAGTVEIALTLTDMDAPEFVHWAIAGLADTAVSIGEETVPLGAYEGTNGTGVVGYTGPCPPSGQIHTYVMTVYYLFEPVDLSDGTPGLDLVEAIQLAALDEASVTGTFSRP
ncbi:MAG: YbhB/YbcL family Raf kinase inhibitor-like protein [Actinomycetota bacterium]|nr:YbhB/YbcL family Raf kinase inhibitor-like protein [Actinomycetota bacterium]